MEWGVNEVLLYGGIALMAAALLAALLCVCLLKLKKKHLDAQLDAEYGAQQDLLPRGKGSPNQKKGNA